MESLIPLHGKKMLKDKMYQRSEENILLALYMANRNKLGREGDI